MQGFERFHPGFDRVQVQISTAKIETKDSSEGGAVGEALRVRVMCPMLGQSPRKGPEIGRCFFNGVSLGSRPPCRFGLAR